MEQAAFSLKNYSFSKVNIDYNNKSNTPDISIDIKPSGVFDNNNSQYILTFIFSAKTKDDKPFIVITCDSLFTLKNVNKLEDIPSFFYKNSISTVTLQANREPMVLPTMNLSALESTLKDHTRTV